MSKAFTRESDLEEDEIIPRGGSAASAGGKNYITPNGERQLRENLKHLVEVTRPGLASGDKEQNRRQLQLLDQKIADLSASMDSAEVVLPPERPDGKVRFGATVTVKDAQGENLTYRIVGVDEMDLDRCWVSWMSPIAKALLGRSEGDRVRFKFPSGEKELTIVSVAYE